MKTELLRKMKLIGFMLMMVSANAFANSANEEKNTLNVVSQKTINLSTSDNTTTIPIVLRVGEDMNVTISEDAGYRYNPNLTDVEEYDGGSIVWDDGARSFVIRITAVSRGRVVLRLVLVAIDGYSTKYVDIVIEIN